MSDRIVIDLSGQAELMRTLGEAVIGLQRPRDLMERIGAVMERNINFRFDAKVAPDGVPWLPLAASTVAHYGSAAYKQQNPAFAAGIPGSLLERTRRMRDSLSATAYDTMVEVGFGDPKAIYHETGTRRGLPRRQMLTDDPVAGTLAASDVADILDELADYLAGRP